MNEIEEHNNEMRMYRLNSIRRKKEERIKSNKGMNECLSEIEEHNNDKRMYIV